MMRIVGADTGLKGCNYYLESNNQNKRSNALDLNTENLKWLHKEVSEM